MPACPGQIVVISFCRGYDILPDRQPPGLYSYDVYLNNTLIGTLPGGQGSRSDIFIGDSLAIAPPGDDCFDHPTIDSQNTFDNSIVLQGLNIVEIDVTSTSGGGPLNGGDVVFTRYDISSGGALTNPIVLPGLESVGRYSPNGWLIAGDSGYRLRFGFNYFCDVPPIIIDPGTTPNPTTTTPNPTTLPPEGCCGCLLIPYEIVNIEDVIFTLPGIALGEPLYLSTTLAPDIITLSINISTTTPLPTTYAPTTTINPTIPTTIIQKQCKCGEVGCNALKF